MAEGDAGNDQSRSTMHFCPVCDFLMEMREEPNPDGTHSVALKCRNCDRTEAAGARVTAYRREYIRSAENFLSKVHADLSTDPTLERRKGPSTRCTKMGCDSDEVVSFQAPPQPTDPRLKLILLCVKCGHKWEA